MDNVNCIGMDVHKEAIGQVKIREHTASKRERQNRRHLPFERTARISQDKSVATKS
jgi:hypothetical protein